MGNKVVEEEFKAILDSGSSLKFPAISEKFFLKLKDWKVIPKILALKRSA